jgi:hypothetical protein
MATTTTSSGLPTTDQPRFHFDIYAILEAPQELYFGHETQVNVNMVETVKLAVDGDVIEKCYISPTKRRGVERRSLIWAPVPSRGVLLGDTRGCGIPHTCAQPDCPICSVYGGLITGNTEVEVLGRKEKRQAATTIGRLVHGGGVAIQSIEPSEKQRAMHPSTMHRGESGDTPMPFKRQYNEPALLYPIYNHCMSITDQEFQAVAYAFLDSLSRLGAGNPKGVRIIEKPLLTNVQPLLVVDRYLAPLGKRPVISPAITEINAALTEFTAAATWVHGQTVTTTTSKIERWERTLFTRWLGNDALVRLQDYASEFVTRVLI